MLLLAASAEQHSVHPLAVAIHKYVKEHEWTVPQHKTSKTVVARGMSATVPAFEDYQGGEVLVGSAKFMVESGVTGMDQFLLEDLTMGYIYVACNGTGQLLKDFIILAIPSLNAMPTRSWMGLLDAGLESGIF